MLAFGAKQKSQARSSGPNEHDAPVKEDTGLCMDMPKQAMGASNDAPKDKGSEHRQAPSKQLGQAVALDHKVGGLMDVPAQPPVRQQQPAADGSRQPVGSKAAAQRTGVGQSAGQAAKMDHAGGRDHAQEARPPFGFFPSTQQSSSQPSSKLAVPAVPGTHSAIETLELEPAEKAQHQQQQGQKQQGQMQSRKAPSMSPSGSSSVRPPQDASRRTSTGHATPAAGLKGLAGVSKQQPQSRADEQGSVLEEVYGRGSGNKMSADAGWKPRRNRKSSALGVQAGTAPGCRHTELKDKDASNMDEQIHAPDHAKGEHCRPLLAVIAAVDQQRMQGSVEQQQRQKPQVMQSNCVEGSQQMGSTSGECACLHQESPATTLLGTYSLLC